MALWKLTPVDVSDPSWAVSSHRGPVIVRAKDEADARSAAAKAFDLPINFPPGQGVRSPPWKRATQVKAERIDDPRYDAEGPTEILAPSF